MIAVETSCSPSAETKFSQNIDGWTEDELIAEFGEQYYNSRKNSEFDSDYTLGWYYDYGRILSVTLSEGKVIDSYQGSK